MPGLDQFDTILSFASIMLLYCIIVTAVVQIMTSAVNLRGWVLKHGVKHILQKIAPALKTNDARKLADHLLQDPTVSHQFFGRTAVAIRQDELVRLLTLFSASKDASQDSVLKTLKETVVAVQDLPAKVGEWFDTMMDRTSELFVSWTQLLTILVSLVLVVGWQIDAIHIYNTLSQNKELRRTFVERSEQILVSPAVQAAVGATNSGSADTEELRRLVQEAKASLATESGVFPTASPIIERRWSFGIFLAWILLSLGAPFWFNLLRNFMSLRPALADKVAKAGQSGAGQGINPGT